MRNALLLRSIQVAEQQREVINQQLQQQKRARQHEVETASIIGESERESISTESDKFLVLDFIKQQATEDARWHQRSENAYTRGAELYNQEINVTPDTSQSERQYEQLQLQRDQLAKAQAQHNDLAAYCAQSSKTYQAAATSQQSVNALNTHVNGPKPLLANFDHAKLVAQMNTTATQRLAKMPMPGAPGYNAQQSQHELARQIRRDVIVNHMMADPISQRDTDALLERLEGDTEFRQSSFYLATTEFAATRHEECIHVHMSSQLGQRISQIDAAMQATLGNGSTRPDVVKSPTPQFNSGRSSDEQEVGQRSGPPTVKT